MKHASFIVKICGITNEVDACVAVEAGANALGFNFYKGSPRYITPPRARSIAGTLPSDCLRVGIFVNASESELLDTTAQVPLDVLQLHGDRCIIPHSPAIRIWRAVAATDAAPADNAAIEAYLVDAPAPQHGGSGHTFDWSLAARFPKRIILAGGLEAANVAEAIRVATPRGVDACSRLESSPGRKDPQRVRDFIRAALAAAPQQVTPEEVTT